MTMVVILWNILLKTSFQPYIYKLDSNFDLYILNVIFSSRHLHEAEPLALGMISLAMIMMIAAIIRPKQKTNYPFYC